jgi:pimeloyl-ACP methyl ester carboxylesterase
VWREWGSGKPLLLLHGGWGSWTHWTRNIAALAARRLVLAPDTPGCGESDLPERPEAPAIAASLWRDLDEIIDPGEKIDIAGFSYGGGIGGDVAGARPEQVDRLVLVGSGGLAPRGSHRDLVKWRHLDAQRQWEAHRRNLAILMLARPENVDDFAIGLQAANATKTRLVSRNLEIDVDIRRALAGKPVALSGIWGGEDYTLEGQPVRVREDVIRALDPAAEFVVLPGAGHWVQYEAADAFNDWLLGLLAKSRFVTPAAHS